VLKIKKSQCKNSLKEDGIFFSSMTQTQEKIKHLDKLKDLIEEGKIKSVIDRSYPMDKIAEAHEYVDKGHKKGNIIISIIQ